MSKEIFTGLIMALCCMSIAGAESVSDAPYSSEQEATETYPCLNKARFHEFDFWIGDWVVHMADGSLAGHNTIVSDEKHCVLLENWRGAAGGTGKSINYFDQSSAEWVQIWNSAYGTQIDIRGGLTDQGMLLTGQIHTVADGISAPFRGLWTLLDDGRVRQFFEQSNDGGKTWVPWFEGVYSRAVSGQVPNEELEE